MAAESNASIDAGAAREIVSSDGATRIGADQGSMRTSVIQGTAGYMTRMSGGVEGEAVTIHRTYGEWLE